MASELPPVIALFEGDSSDFDEVCDAIEQRLADLDDSRAEPDVGLNDDDFDAVYDDITARFDELDADHADPSVGLDTDDFEAKYAEVEGQLAALGVEELDLDRLAAQLDEANSSMNGAFSPNLGEDALANLLALQTALDQLGASGETAAAGLDEVGASADAAAAGFADVEAGSLAAISALDTFDESSIDMAEAASAYSLTIQDATENVIDFGTAIAELEEIGLDAELGFQLLEGSVVDVEDAMADAEDAVVDAEIAIQDLELLLADGEEVLQDFAEGVDVLEQALGAGGGALNTFIEYLGTGGSMFKEWISGLSAMDVIVPALVGALLAAIPTIGAFVGELGALSAIGFTGLVGAGAVILGMAGDFSVLGDAVKGALSSYETALKPFTKPIENDSILLIADAFKQLEPIAEKTAPYIEKIIEDFGKDMSSPSFEKFITWVGNNAGPALETVTDFITNVGKALAQMGETGQPFIDMIEKGLDSLGKDLDKFSDSKTFKDFIDWLVTNGPTVGHDLESIGDSFGKIFVALTPTGLTLLDGFTHAMSMMADVMRPVGVALDALAKGFDKIPQPIKDAMGDLAGFLTGISALANMGPGIHELEQLYNTLHDVASAAHDVESAFNSIHLPSFLGGGGGGGGVLNELYNLSGLPHLAGGGEVVPGQPYVVGEHGPELMIPSLGGQMIPNDALGDLSGGLSHLLSTGPELGAADLGGGGDSYHHSGDIIVNGSNLSAGEVGSAVAEEVRKRMLRQARQQGQRGGVLGSYAGSR
ncbi:MAG TPA: hypothetical protein VN886_08855 [Acidimicrobiales bacterium]|nr:hypothetical protein [Acidimicrobiales bacterium]